MAAEPKNSTRLRSAIETEAPTADLIWVVSAVSRDISSPIFAVSKKAADSCVMRSNTARAQIGDHALAERGDEVVAQRAGAGEHGHDRDHHREILVDQPDPLGREAEIDHAPHRDRHRQRRQRRDQEGQPGRPATRPR